MIHHRRRVDENQKGIVAALAKIGACVIDLSGSGGGVMDLLVCYRRNTWMVEIKNPTKPKADQSLTPAQIKMHRAIADAGCEVHVIRTIDEAIALVKA
jgi:hypothetical protein